LPFSDFTNRQASTYLPAHQIWNKDNVILAHQESQGVDNTLSFLVLPARWACLACI